MSKLVKVEWQTAKMAFEMGVEVWTVWPHLWLVGSDEPAAEVCVCEPYAAPRSDFYYAVAVSELPAVEAALALDKESIEETIHNVRSAVTKAMHNPNLGAPADIEQVEAGIRATLERLAGPESPPARIERDPDDPTKVTLHFTLPVTWSSQ